MKNILIIKPFSPANLLGFSLFSTIMLNTGISLAIPSAILTKLQFNPKLQQLEISLSATTQPEYFYLNQPPRLVVDLPNTKLGNVNTNKNYSGKVQRIRVSQFSPHITRIVIDLEPGNFVDVNKVKLQPISPKNLKRWLLKPHISRNITNPSNNLSPAELMTLPPPVTNLPQNQQPFVIVPPLNSTNPTQTSNLIIIPANSTNPSQNPNLITIPNPQTKIPNSQNYTNQIFSVPIIEFGQPLPITKY